jgi:hypothetical protein
MTAYPFIILDPKLLDQMAWHDSVLEHEKVHLAQQRRWFIYGLGVGLLVWAALYWLALPVWWNPWRRRWETEAFRKQGLTDSRIREILAKRPYYLSP